MSACAAICPGAWSYSHWISCAESLEGFLLVEVSMTELRERELVNGLDGSKISNDGESWWITVYSVQTLNDHRWLQLGLIGARDYSVTLRIPLAARSPEVRTAIAQWLRHPNEHESDIVSVA